MNELKEFLILIPAGIILLVCCFIIIAAVILLMASPLIAIGIGASFIAWATCLPLSIC